MRAFFVIHGGRQESKRGQDQEGTDSFFQQSPLAIMIPLHHNDLDLT
jgi:hypothetical protein